MKETALPRSKLFSYCGRYIPHHEIGLERYNLPVTPSFHRP